MKDKKYGFGGKKRNLKRNDAKGYAGGSSLPAMKRPGAKMKNKKGQKPKGNRNKSRKRQ